MSIIITVTMMMIMILIIKLTDARWIKMPMPISIDALLTGGVIKNERIELKETWDPAASLKTICAFANDIDNRGGGYLIIGVRENPDSTR